MLSKKKAVLAVGYETIDDYEKATPEMIKKANEKSVWIPRLDQLLAEISKTEWKWVLFSTGGIFLENDEKGTWHEIECENNEANVEAAAQALLWILEQEGAKA